MIWMLSVMQIYLYVMQIYLYVQSKKIWPFLKLGRATVSVVCFARSSEKRWKRCLSGQKRWKRDSKITANGYQAKFHWILNLVYILTWISTLLKLGRVKVPPPPYMLSYKKPKPGCICKLDEPCHQKSPVVIWLRYGGSFPTARNWKLRIYWFF